MGIGTRTHIFVDNNNHVARWVHSGNWKNSPNYEYEKELLENYKGCVIYLKGDTPTSMTYYSHYRGIITIKLNDLKNVRNTLEHIKHNRFMIGGCYDCKTAQVDYLKNRNEVMS